MKFTGRAVIAFVLLTMFATCLVTLTIVNAPMLVNSPKGVTSPDNVEGFTSGEFKKLSTTLNLIEKEFYSPVDRQKLIDGAIDGMMDSLQDPYSVYINQESAEQFASSLQGVYSGIGAEVTIENNQVVVLSSIKGTPADRAGIRPKDVFVSINGEKLEGLKLHEAIDKIRGSKGTKAKIKVKRAGVNDLIEFVIVRTDINVETVFAKMLADAMGYIEIRQFNYYTAKRFREEIIKLEANGMKGLIMDVRNNPGGLVPIVEEIAEHFVPKGKIISQTEKRNNVRKQDVSKGKGPKSYPIVMLVNEGSASAAEILAGALQDHQLAKLVGVTTFGKGTVQVSYAEELGDGSLLKMTVSKWLTPNGSWIHKKGIKPDVEIRQPDYYYAMRMSKEHVLRYNMSSDDVKSAQMMLNGLDLKTGRTDGYYDHATEKAVKLFQKQVSLEPTGNLDSETAARLELEIKKRLADEAYDAQLNKAIEVLRQEIE